MRHDSLGMQDERIAIDRAGVSKLRVRDKQ